MDFRDESTGMNALLFRLLHGNEQKRVFSRWSETFWGQREGKSNRFNTIACVRCAPSTASFNFTESNHFCHSGKHAEKAIFSFRASPFSCFFFSLSFRLRVWNIYGWCVRCSRRVAGTFVFLLNTHHKYAVRVKSNAVAWPVRAPAIHWHAKMRDTSVRQRKKNRINHSFRANLELHMWSRGMDGFFIHLTQNTLILFSSMRTNELYIFARTTI